MTPTLILGLIGFGLIVGYELYAAITHRERTWTEWVRAGRRRWPWLTAMGLGTLVYLSWHLFVDN